MLRGVDHACKIFVSQWTSLTYFQTVFDGINLNFANTTSLFFLHIMSDSFNN